MIDCGCTTTSICSYGTPKRWCASISSRPLFMSVAESIVILPPIVHVGCASASSIVTFWSSSRERPRNGPPDAVSVSLSIVPGRRSLRISWKSAECSESTGMIDAPVASASAMTSSPPTTSDSLFASARSMPSPSDATVGPRPADPTSAFSTRSAPLSVTSLTSPSGPLSTSPSVQRSAARAVARSSARPIRLTPNWAACSSSSVSLDPAASATTSRPLERETTSRAWVPIDPVDPAMTMRRTQASLGAPDLRRLRAVHAHHVQVLMAASQRRLAGRPEPAGVHLLVQHAGLERGPLVRDHPSAPDRDDLEVVVGMAFVVLLPVAPAHARASGHEDPGARTVPSGLPRSLAGGHAAVRVELLRVLAEVPDVAGTVLRVPVERVLDHAAVLEHPVVHDAGAAAGYGAGLVRHHEDVLRRRAFVGAR